MRGIVADSASSIDEGEEARRKRGVVSVSASSTAGICSVRAVRKNVTVRDRGKRDERDLEHEVQS